MTKRGTLTLSGVVIEEETPALLQSPEKRVSAIELVMSRQWAIQPELLETIVSIAERTNPSPEAISEKLGRPLANTRVATMRGNVAIVPLTGPVFRRANMFSEISGATSVEQFLTDIRTAADNSKVSAIVLDIDSGGGDATSISEVADRVREISKIKPVIAYIDGLGASAAYWIAAAASEVVISKTGIAGSIGVVMSVRRNKDTNFIEFVSSQSPFKRVDPDTEEGKAAIQKLPDTLAQIFIESVAQFRGVSVDTVLADFGQGGVKVGAEAVKAGMADRVGSLESIIAGLSGKKNRDGGISMSGTENEDKPVINRAYLDANHPDLVKAIRAEGYSEGVTKGAEDERNRIKSVEEQMIAGHEALIETLKFDGKTTGAEAAVKVLAAEKQARGDALAARKADAPKPVPAAAAPGSPAPKVDPDAPIEERAKAEWDADPALRSEFSGDFDAYLAYAQANDAGLIKVLKK